ncbi:MAG: caspase family protein [Actinobacteria bacterium]|nr:caspase family protein [Actinomycetota bacterium]
MKKFQILIIIFIILNLSGLTGCACGYFTDKPDQDGSNIDNTDDIATNSSDDPDTGDSQKDTGDSQNNTDNTSKDTGSTQTPQKYAIIASGASYDSQHYAWFLNSTSMAYKLLKNNGYPDENIYYLFESAKESNVDYEATIGNFKKVIEGLQEKAGKTDTIVLFLIGHGTYRGTNSYYTLNGYNLSDVEMASMFKNVKRDKLIFVFSPCNSGGFVDDLSGKNTVVITSTRKDETNSAAFIEPFLASFDGIGDANSDGKVSFAEAFNYASNNVSDQYINNNWGTITEHAQLDDNGDAISHEAPVPSGGDGQLAEDIYLK